MKKINDSRNEEETYYRCYRFLHWHIWTYAWAEHTPESGHSKELNHEETENLNGLISIKEISVSVKMWFYRLVQPNSQKRKKDNITPTV